MRHHRDQDVALEVGDRRAAAILVARALMEIRYLADPVRRQAQGASPEDDLDRILFLASLATTCPESPGHPPGNHPARTLP